MKKPFSAVLQRSFIRVVDANNKTLATVDLFGEGTEVECAQVAVLFAASPDLLESLERLAAAADAFANDQGQASTAALAMALTLAQASIAAAQKPL